MSSCKLMIIDAPRRKNLLAVGRIEVKAFVSENGWKSNSCCCSNSDIGNNIYFTIDGKVFIFMNSYVMAMFLNTIARSPEYRTAWLNHVGIKLRRLYAVEVLPTDFYLDRAWRDRVEYLARERAEVEHAFSWLSTLGGAFSALGDSFTHCAVMAGKISWAQLNLAIRLGDPIMKCRCYLYMALSLAQLGQLKKAKHIVKLVSKSQPCLQSICQGVNAHFYRLKKTMRGS